MEHCNFYKNKIFAGPMMKVSNFPFRLMCLENGADAVFGPAINCEMLLASKVENNIFYLGNPSKNEVLFRTAPEEEGKLIFQLFSNDSSKAVLAVEKIFSYVSAVDLNCGCPSNFATNKGQGNAMVKTPELIEDILKSLRRNYGNLPISVKFRINDDIDSSIQLAKMCESSGASAITLHGRLAENRHKGDVKYKEMKTVFDTVSISKIANGGIKNKKEALEIMKNLNCDSAMISSAALRNPRVFSDFEIVNNTDVINNMKTFIDICYKYHCSMNEFRFYLLEMMSKFENIQQSLGYNRIKNAKNLQSIRDLIYDEKLFPC